MENGKDWQYDTSLTVRLDRKLKNRIEREAEKRNLCVSEYFRVFFDNAELVDTFFDRLPDEYRQFIEKHIAHRMEREGKSRYDIVSGLVTMCVERAMDSGAFLDFRRR